MWLDEAGAAEGKAALRQSARNLLRQAADAARPATWVRELRPFPEDDTIEIAPVDIDGARRIAAWLESGVNRTKHEELVRRMRRGLAETDAGQFEPALSDLGKLLGAEASEPAGQGRCDSLWRWDDLLCLAIEAKSEQDPNGQVSLDDIRQANTHLRLVASDRGLPAPPAGSATVIVSPRSGVDPNGVNAAERHVHLASPQTVCDLAGSAEEFWTKLLVETHSLTGERLVGLVASLLNEHGLLPSQVPELMTAIAIRD